MVAPDISLLRAVGVDDAWGLNVTSRLHELSSNDDPAYRALINRTLDYLKQLVPPCSKVLDAGCGIGFLSAALGQAGYDVTAIDPSAGSIEVAIETHKNFRGEFVEQSMHDFASAEVAGHRFDAVVANMTLHNVEHLQTFFAGASRVLNAKGVLYASIPNPRTYLQSRADVDIASRNLSEPQHFLRKFGIRNHTPHPASVDYYHYPLKTYISCARSAGLYLADFEVPEHIGAGRPRDIMILVFKRI